MALLIRPATPDDAPALQALVRAAHDGLPLVTEEYVARHTVCGAWEGARLAGFFALEARGETWWLAHLWVAERDGRRGRGRWMLTDAVRRARRLGADSLLVRPEGDAGAFFRSMGARPSPDRAGAMELDLATWMEPLPESVSELGWIE